MIAGPSLCSPLQLGPLELHTRNFMASLTRNRCIPTNVPNEVNVLYYTQRAQGGAGLIRTEGTLISPQGTQWPHAPGIWSDEHVVAWKKVTDAVHDAGGAIFVQLWHVGRIAHPDMPEHKASGKPVYAPSAVPARGGKFRTLPGQPGYGQPVPLEDPWGVIADYRNAAENAMRAGFDGVELHAGSGWLPHQFLDTTSNHRTDEWGGCRENRLRFTREVLREIVDVCGAERVGVRLSPGGGYNDMGMPLQETLETFRALIRELVAMHVAYVELMRATPPPRSAPDPTQPNPGTFHDVLAAYGHLVKAPGSRTRLILNGDLTPAAAGALIRAGRIDAASFGRSWISNPDFQRRVESGASLATEGDWPESWYVFEKDPRDGYTDYPTVT